MSREYAAGVIARSGEMTVPAVAAGFELRGMSKSYGRTRALSDAGCVMRRGQITVLIGANGAGKSTLMRCAAGVLRPDAGEVMLDGRRLVRPWRDVLLVPETPQVFDDLTVGEHIAFVARSRNVANPRAVDDALERFGLIGLRARMGGMLSKGERQRTLIACAAAADPVVLLLDEPFVGLDPSGQRETVALLAEFAHADRVVCVSTHLLERAEELAGAVVLMDAGRASSWATWEAFQNSEFARSHGMVTRAG